jgi:HlyD family secretion protein
VRARKQAATRGVEAGVTRYIVGGLAVAFLLVGGLGVWAATTQIAGAIVAQGLVVVETNVKKVQHPTGGIVGDIYVKNGKQVKAGDLLLRLDETLTRVNLQMVTKQLDELAVREARLKAERDDAATFAVPDILLARTGESEIKEILKGEESLIRSRRESVTGQKSQLSERSLQLTKEAEGVAAQIDAKRKEIGLIADELEGLAVLEAKQLVTTTKVAALKREKARLEGELGQYEAAAAQTSGRKAEIALQIVRLEQEMRTEVVKELREVQSKIAELSERRIAAEDQLRRVDIRAPQSGVVHQLAVFNRGGVINPGEPILLIVPEGDRLVIEARVAPQDIDQLSIGQKTFIRFAAFDQQTTPEVMGEVISVSADLIRDQVTGESYFTARIAMPETELAKLGSNKLQPGIPADIQIKTQDRTALSYLMKPLSDQINKAFRGR